jgi:mono/diheme cytochrome c family protein
MSLLKSVAKISGAILAVVTLTGLGAMTWSKSVATDKLTRVFHTHSVDFPIPFPLTDAELAELRLPPSTENGTLSAAAMDFAAVARTRAAERGKHLVEARYACTECHGANFAGGTMVDDPALGRLLGPNLTSGKGSRTAGYSTKDWDRIVRHGILPDGRPAAMPSMDFFAMSDRELSDIVSYIATFPPIDAEVPAPTLGPIGNLLVATGKMPLSADLRTDHEGAHLPQPPVAEATATFGKHLVAVCTGCHSASLAGGPVLGGDPSWPPASNLTPHADGLSGWTYDDFVRAMREAKRPDGTALREPMSKMTAFAANLDETELRAMWAFLSTLSPKPSPR